MEIGKEDSMRLSEKLIEKKNNQNKDYIFSQLKRVLPSVQLARAVDTNPAVRASGATILSEASFNAARKNKEIDNLVKYLEEKHPAASILSKVAGTVASLPVGGIVAKGVAKLPAVGKGIKAILRSKSNIGKGAAAGSGYGMLMGVGEGISNEDADMPTEIVKGIRNGAILGGLGSGALSLLAKKKAAPKSIRDVIAKKLGEKINPKNMEEVINVRKLHHTKGNKKLYSLLSLGNESLQRIANAAGLRSEKARALIQREKNYFKENQFDELKKKLYQHLRGKDYQDMPTSQEFVEMFRNRINKESQPYFRHFEKGEPIEINSKLKGDYDFKKENAKAFSRINDELKKSGKIVPNSPEVLHETKRGLQDLVEKYKKNDPSLMRKAELAAKELREILGKASPSYDTAMRLEKKGFDVKDAANLGHKLTKNPTETLRLKIKDISPAEREAVKLGYINELIDNASKSEMASKAELKNIAAEFKNDQRRTGLKELLGDKDSEKLLEDTDRLYRGANNLSNLLGGSSTIKNLEDISNVGQKVSGVIMRPKKSLLKFVAGKVGKLSGENPKEEVIKIRMLTNPELLKDRLKKIKEASKDFTKKKGSLENLSKKSGLTTSVIGSHLKFNED
jgi:hypothetical protein